MERPVVGITMASLTALEGVAAPQPESSVVGERYVRAIARAGALPWPIPVGTPLETLEAVYARLDGLLLPGGSDIRPATYGALPHPLLDRGDPERDGVEHRLATWAWRDGKPVLGICRGMQVLNVTRGGTLVQDLGSARPGSLKHDWFPMAAHPRDRMSHLVRAEPGTLAERILGSDLLAVNSIHHQAVDRPGAGLLVSASATDGVVEAVEATGHPFFLGVQWHPEEFPRHRIMRGIFEALAEAAERHRGRRSETAAPALDVAGRAS